MKKLYEIYDKNVNLIKSSLLNREDLICRELEIGKHHFAVMYILGLCDSENISKLIISPITKSNIGGDVIEELTTKILLYSDLNKESDCDKIVSEILKGKAVLICDDESQAIIIELDKHSERSITEPPTSAVIRGPRNGFVENIKTNLSSLKNILQTKYFTTKSLSIGKETQTSVAIVYLSNIADQKIVDEIEKKLKMIDIDGILDSYYIAQFLETRKGSIFKQAGSTEKPDIVASKLLEGRVAIIVDNSPFVLTLPFILLEEMQSSNDYYSEKTHATMVRIIRLLSLFVTILLPGMYIAIELFHYRTIPLKYLITILNTTQGLPLTPLLEIVFVLVLFEILYEASIRMPRYLGQAMSIVGALILGDTAVKAGIVSPPAVMVVALSSISVYIIPDSSSQLSLLRFLFCLAGGLLGFYGITGGFIFLLLYLNDFDAYNTPYLGPVAPYIASDMKDFAVKADLTNMKTRPKSIPNHNQRRQT